MQQIKNRTEKFVLTVMGQDASGHDFHHIERVRKNALAILKMENAGDAFIIEMAALLHDIPDEKLNESQQSGWAKLTNFLDELNLSSEVKRRIVETIETVSYKGGNNIQPVTLEGKIVQDADRLDALGAIGIARTFAYGGNAGHAIYEPKLPVRENMSITEYRGGNTSSVHHFYEKLLKLKDSMHTETARQIAEKRHRVMVDYLQQFYSEWNGNA
ncbi:HD domain-containing protein [Bacillus massilinigeriensis]|uniref:HD domain-containing protein n=1 Tax=Bacillus mediterraneensis TaxID=1805474 RepID=UPI000A550691